MVDREHRVRLAAAESCLKLDDRLAALADQPLRHLREQEPHTLGYEGAVKKRNRVLVLGRGLSRMNRRDICRELGLLERSFQNVAVRDSNFSPGLHRLFSLIVKTAPPVSAVALWSSPPRWHSNS
jgi:hypothetical protein